MKFKLSLNMLFLTILMILISWWLWGLVYRTPINLAQLRDHQKIHIRLGKKLLPVEVVNTNQSLTQGLSGRQEIGSDGMLFVLPAETIPTFWMKGMEFDLDLVWINDFKVVEITPNVPRAPKNLSSSQLPTYHPTVKVDMVLEIKSGFSHQWTIKVGDQLTVADSK